MAYREWNGNAQAVYDVWNATLGGTLGVGDLIKVLCSDKTFTYTTTTTVIADQRTLFIAAFNALDAQQYPELAEYTASASATAGVVTFTQKVAGRPGTLSVAITSTSGTWSITNTTPATGPNFWNNARNWVQDTVPVTGDDVFIANTTVAIKYGLAQSGVTLATFKMNATARNQIGLPKVNESGGYAEYRDTELAIGITSGDIGLGATGGGSSFVRLNTGTVQTDLRIHLTASGGNDGTPALLWRGTHADNAVTIAGGSVGIGYYGEAATVKTLQVGSRENATASAVEIGDAVTMTGTGATFKQSGGVVNSRSSFKTVEKFGGELHMNDGGCTGVLKNWGGLLRWEASGDTIDTLTNGGEFKRLSTLGAGTITNVVTMLKDSSFEDPNGTLTLSAGWTTYGCKLSQLRELDLGPNRTYTVA